MKKIDVWKRKMAKEQRKRWERQAKVNKMLGLKPAMVIIDDPMWIAETRGISEKEAAVLYRASERANHRDREGF